MINTANKISEKLCNGDIPSPDEFELLFDLFDKNSKKIENKLNGKEQSSLDSFVETSRNISFASKKSSILMFDHLIKNNLDKLKEGETLKDSDGFQAYNSENTKKEVKDTSLMGSFDAMFVDMDNEVAEKHNNKETDFIISDCDVDHCIYTKFKINPLKEFAVHSNQKGYWFSSITAKARYIRYNLLIKTDNGYTRVVASKGINVKQINIYLLDEELNIIDNNKNSVFQYLDVKGNSYLKNIEFKKEYITEINSNLYSYKDNCYIAKNLSSILESYSDGHNLFSEPKIRGFDFPIVDGFEKYKEDQHTHEGFILNVYMVGNQGLKEYGRIGNKMLHSQVQSNFFLLDEFTDLERDRFLLNKKAPLNIHLFDYVDFSQKNSLMKLVNGSDSKLELMDATTVYSSNIHPLLGRKLFAEQDKWFNITLQDINVEDFVRYKINKINETCLPSIKLKPLKTDLSDYVFSITDNEIYLESGKLCDISASLILTHKDNIKHAYRNHFNNLDDLSKLIDITNLRNTSYFLDKRASYKNYVINLLKDAGASEVKYIENAKEPEMNDVLLNVEREEFSEDKNVWWKYKIKYGDKNYFSLENKSEDFCNIFIENLFNFNFKSILKYLKDKKDEKTVKFLPNTDLNSVYLITNCDDFDEQLQSKFKNITITNIKNKKEETK